MSIVLLSYNSSRISELFHKCLVSLLSTDYPSFEVVLLDNGSSDDCTKQAFDKYRRDNLRLIRSTSNLGFAGGNNFVVTHGELKGELIAFVNTDVIVSSNWLRPIVHAMLHDKRLGSCAPIFVNQDFVTVYDAGGFSSLGGVFKSAKFAPSERPYYVGYGTGACLVTWSKLFKRLGGFTESFFMNFEEIDYCSRLRSIHFENGVVPTSKVFHAGNATWNANKLSALASYLLARNKLFYLFQNREPIDLVMSVFLVLMNRLGWGLLVLRRKDYNSFLSIIKGLYSGLLGMKRGQAAYGRKPFKDNSQLPVVVDFLVLFPDSFTSRTIQGIVCKQLKKINGVQNPNWHRSLA